MSVVAAGTRIWLAAGATEMRKGFTGLSGLVQSALASNPFCGHVFVFRGRRGDLLKLLWWDGTGLCLMTKRLERGRWKRFLERSETTTTGRIFVISGFTNPRVKSHFSIDPANGTNGSPARMGRAMAPHSTQTTSWSKTVERDPTSARKVSLTIEPSA
jgi:hypothetical protein